jgi:hypothetical protein
VGWLQALAAEFLITLSDGTVWLSIGEGLLFGAACLLLGIWVARFVRLLPPDAPAGETLGVGLASGLLVLAACWAAIASTGRSSFTPVAIGFAVAIGLAAARRWRPHEDVEPVADVPPGPRRVDLIVAVAGSAAFVVVVALLYGSTLTQSPRDGVQPLEFNDVAYYSLLGSDLARTGTESLYSPSGFASIDELPPQTWYHWGESWLGAVVITVFGTPPLDTHNLIVLPLALLAAAALTGTLVRRATGATSRGAFLFGFLACLFLAPVPFIPGQDFGIWAVGLIFGITLYGLAAVAVLLALYSLVVLAGRRASWPLAIFVGSAAALILPAHVVIAGLALVGVGSVWTIRVGQSLIATRRLPAVTPVWRQTNMATAVALATTIAWGWVTGHGIGTSGQTPGVSPFNQSWREAMAITIICSGAFFAIPIAWFLVRKRASIEAGLYVGTGALLVVGALVWGALLADIFTFHLFFAGLAVFATPVAAVAVWSIWLRLRATGHARLAVAVLFLCATQLEFGVGLSVLRLWRFGPGSYPPVPVAVLAEIRSLPADAKLAYACRPFEEASFWNAALIGIDAHAGRPIVPMCFQAATFGLILGTPISREIQNPLFQSAPQRALYPDADAHPSTESVISFLRDNGIEYIYADALHPNSLVPGAVPVATSGDTQVLRIP